MATTVAVRRPARYQTMKLRRVTRLAGTSVPGWDSTSVAMAGDSPSELGCRGEIYHRPRFGLGR
jgi:hypothetical protein